MADTVSTLTILETPAKLVQKFLNKSDSTGESSVTKVTLSSHTSVMQGGVIYTPDSMIIEKIEYSIQGMEVQILAVGTSNIVLATLAGYGSMHLHKAVGLNSVNTGTGAGNIAFTTIGAAANSTYDITLYMRKKFSAAI